MNKIILCGVFILLTTALSGCNDNKNNGDAATGSGDTTELEGRWNDIACYYWKGDFSKGSVTFSGSTYSSSGTNYSDSECTVSIGAYTASGTFVIGNTMITSSGLDAKEYNATLLKSNGISFNVQLFDIFKIEGGKLYFGDDSGQQDTSTKEKRPTDLDFINYLVKN